MASDTAPAAAGDPARQLGVIVSADPEYAAALAECDALEARAAVLYARRQRANDELHAVAAALAASRARVAKAEDGR